eukprot:2250153-Heterocapsa_arctica.AAC.1
MKALFAHGTDPFPSAACHSSPRCVSPHRPAVLHAACEPAGLLPLPPLRLLTARCCCTPNRPPLVGCPRR